jgi:uncharacterized protein
LAALAKRLVPSNNDHPPELAMTTAANIVFSPSTRAIQSRKGSRQAYARRDLAPGFHSSIDANLGEFIAAQTSVFLATASADGQPYIQHRGGPAGFLRVLDEHTIAFADFKGNRQFITQGNLQDNAKAYLFLIDYSQLRRIKVWGTARVVEGDDALLQSLMPQGYSARGEQVVLFTVTAWDENCSQHIPQRFEAHDVRLALEQRDSRITALEAELAALRTKQGSA